MRDSPRLPDGYDPQRILLGDVDGDGLADLVYVDDGRDDALDQPAAATAGASPIDDPGHPARRRRRQRCGSPTCSAPASAACCGAATPRGTGRAGDVLPRPHRRDQAVSAERDGQPHRRGDPGRATPPPPASTWPTQPARRPAGAPRCRSRSRSWPASRPSTTISRGKLTTEYRYHHGYWDGAEREFRGFGRVEQLDTETFDDYHSAGLHPGTPFNAVDPQRFSPPTLTRTWFHLGPVDDGDGDWAELDCRSEYWRATRRCSDADHSVDRFLRGVCTTPAAQPTGGRGAMPCAPCAAASCAPSCTRSTARPDRHRPYTVTEYAYDLREEPSAGDPGRPRVFFPFQVAQRTTQWERGDDPMTQFTFTGDYDSSRAAPAADLGRDAAPLGMPPTAHRGGGRHRRARRDQGPGHPCAHAVRHTAGRRVHPRPGRASPRPTS